MKRYLLAILALLTLVAVLQLSQPEPPEPVVYWKVVGVPVEVIKEVEIIREVPVIKEVPVTEYITIPPIEIIREARQFNDVKEMIGWVNNNHLPIVLVRTVLPSGVIVTNYTQQMDCDDYALELQRRALVDGFIINAELDYSLGYLHMLNSAVIGNELWYIEPQDGRYWFKVKLD